MKDLYDNYTLSNYYPNLNKKHTHGGVSVIVLSLFVIILLGLAFFLKPREKTYSYFFLSVDEYSNYNSAKEKADEVYDKLGAGYIFYKDKYYVLTSVYINHADAENVLQTIKQSYPKASLIECEIATLSSNTTTKIKDIYTSSKTYLEQTYKSLNRLVTDDTSANTILLSTKEYTRKLSDSLGDYIKDFKNYKSTYAISENLYTFREKLNIFYTHLDESKGLATYRYDFIELILKFSSFSHLF